MPQANFSYPEVDIFALPEEEEDFFQQCLNLFNGISSVVQILFTCSLRYTSGTSRNPEFNVWWKEVNGDEKICSITRWPDGEIMVETCDGEDNTLTDFSLERVGRQVRAALCTLLDQQKPILADNVHANVRRREILGLP